MPFSPSHARLWLINRFKRSYGAHSKQRGTFRLWGGVVALGGVAALILVLLLESTTGDAQSQTATRSGSSLHLEAVDQRNKQLLDSLDDLAGDIQVDPSVETAAQAFQPVEIYSVPVNWEAAGLDPKKGKLEKGKWVQRLQDGSKITYTIDPDLQIRLQKILDRYKVPHGGVVLLEPDTGRVLAMASYTRKDPYLPDIVRKSVAPSASVFKIVTASALIEGKGIVLTDKVCYHGGFSYLTESNIKGNPKLDRRCDRDLGDALAFSVNSIFAKLAYKNLEKEDLEQWARRFGYNRQIPFELPVEISVAEFPDDPIERARSAAGFWHTYLSPLHAAMLGATLANDGVMMQPSLIERYEDPKGRVLLRFEPKVFSRPIQATTAKQLAEAMYKTTWSGTARNSFRFRAEFPSSSVRVSGKTGTLSRKKPSYLGYTWFAGFGERQKGTQESGEDKKEGGGRVAVSGLICNTPIWHIKGSYIASEALRFYFENR